MALTDLPLAQLREYRSDAVEPADFDAFWSATIAESRARGDAPLWEAVDAGITQLHVDDLTFPGFGGEPIRAWVTRPLGEGPYPAVVEFVGYGGGRGRPSEHLRWAAAGYVHVVMDTRGQGSVWGTGGDTPDPHGSGPAVPGYMTRGIHDPHEYYYRRVFTDGVRLVDAVRTLPFVDAARIALTGGSQGGGISLAVGALAGELRAVMPDVPFLCDFPRSVAMTPKAPFTELTQYLSIHRDHDVSVFRTLGYFDGVAFARRITAPVLMSVALMDEVVLPSTVFAAYNELTVDERELVVYPYNGHEAGQTVQWQRQLAWLGTLPA